MQKKGYFYDMVQQTGISMANSLTEIAKNVSDKIFLKYKKKKIKAN